MGFTRVANTTVDLSLPLIGAFCALCPVPRCPWQVLSGVTTLADLPFFAYKPNCILDGVGNILDGLGGAGSH